MFVKIISLLLVSVAVAQASLVGVDPNTLQCDPLGLEFLLLPHFSDCNKFYTCVHGREVEMTCASPQLVFDFELQTCNWAWAADCVLRTPAGEESETEEAEGDELEGSSEGSGEGSGDLDWADSSTAVHPAGVIGAALSGLPDCTSHLTASSMVAYTGDCQRYWRCVNGLPHTFYCSDGLYFNQRTMQCDFEANVRCSINQDEELNGEFLVY